MARHGVPPGDRREGGPNPVDVHVGSRVRLRRTLLGMSQEKLGEAIGLTFQQVQKYERGTNRIGASRLFDLSKVLDVPVGFFFEELGDWNSKAAGRGRACAAEPRTAASREGKDCVSRCGSWWARDPYKN